MNRVLRVRLAGLIALSIGILLVLSACGGDKADESQADRSAPSGEGIAAWSNSGASAQVNFAAATPKPPAQQGNMERLVIKNGQMSLQVEDVGDALNQVMATAAQYGGYVISSTRDSNPKYDTATITIAVESTRFETAMNDLRKLGLKVLHDSASGQDVTAEYVDLESRLRSLEATRVRIMSFLESAQNVDEALIVNDRLAQIDQEIEQVKGRMNYLAGRAAFSTITVSLQENPAVAAQQGWSPKRAFNAAVDAQSKLARLLFDAAIWVVIFLGPYILVAVLLLLGWRGWLRRHKTA